ncbi:hypothetical protein [Chryseobacterium cucumeris]|nr:hypothetical protein [Chryseobacterium cucumeris]MDH5032547.1 hypothetical protein [Chryseobacterium cucumeris]
MENIANQNVRIMPEVLIGGSGDSANGGISGLLGLQLLEQVQKKNGETVSTSEEKPDNNS